jgi:hypothetical protein
VSSDSYLESWNFADPAHPVRAASVLLPAPPTDYTLSGDLLLASCQTGGLLVFDVSDPAAPERLSTFTMTGTVPGQVAVYGNLMAVAAGTLGYLLVDITNPSAPVQVGSWAGDSYTFVSGVGFANATTLWVMNKRHGFLSFYVADPGAPVELGKMSTDSNYGRIYCYEGYVYCAAEYVGVTVLEASDPSKPEQLNNFEGATDAYHMFLSGDTLLLSDGVTGIRAYSLEDPANPCPTAYFEAPGFAYGAGILANGATVVSCREGGLWGLSPDSCDGPVLKLPCEGAAVAPFYPPIFTWNDTPGAEYKVEVSTDPGFPEGDKTLVGTAGGAKKLKVPGWVPGDKSWNWMKKQDRKGKTLYWRVALFVGSEKSYSEARTFVVY